MVRTAIILFALGLALPQRATAQVLVSPSSEEMATIRGSKSNRVGMKVKIPSLEDESAGAWSSDGGLSTWTLIVQADHADGVIVYFDELILPPGATISARSADGSFATRVFWRNDNRLVRSFALPAVPSTRVVVEATMPSSLVGGFRAVVSEVGCIVAKAGDASMGFGDAPGCYINVNCPDGLPWQNPKKAVAQYTYTVGSEIGDCTGTLVNNTALDDRNLFLSAQHCAMEATPAELGQVIFYFNYEAPGCANPSSPAGLRDQTVVGCTRLAASGGVHPLPPDGSDFQLLELNPIPEAYGVYYAGWNRSPIGAGIPMPGAIIQHPLADIKKISLISAFEQGMSGSDFVATCVQSGGRGGIVEPNSSGSGVFDSVRRVIGTVSYGSTGCVVPGGINLAGGGKFSVHWNGNGSAPNRQLRPWLDPLNTGVMVLDGKPRSLISVEDGPPRPSTSILVHPNPARDIIDVDFSALRATDNGRAYVYTPQGRGVMEIALVSGRGRADVSALPAGVYFIGMRYGDVRVGRKILKLR